MAANYNGHKDKDDDDYDYSDSFVSDEDDESVKKSTNTTRKVAQVTARRKPPKQRGYKGRISSRATTQSNEPKVDNAVQRMLSSKQLRINELKNELEDFKNTLQDLREENKLLKKTQQRQEKALNKFENDESDLPQLLQRHNNEVRTLKEQLKKAQEKYQKTDRYLRDAEDELDKTKNKLTKFKGLAEDNNLLERQELQNKLRQAEIDLEEREVKVKDLEKHIKHLNKNHRHELGIEIARHRDLQKQLETMRNENDELQIKFKEKVKAVELANIYSLRKGHKLPASYSGTPNRTPPQRRKRVPSLHELTPREKMKMFEDKRKEEERLQREQQERQKKEKEEESRRRSEEEERRRQRERDEQEMRDLEQLEQERRHRENREKEEQRKRDQEAEQWLKKMEAEKKSREAEEQRVREEQQRKERDERDRRERERQEQERRAKDERDRMEMDAQLAEERMKKDELLKKLRMIDEGQNKPAEKKTTGNDLFFATSNKQRRDSDGAASSSSSKKSYSFTKPVENMHHGKPAREDVTVPYIERQKKQQQRESSPVSGYQPSAFGLSSGITGGGKKTKKTGGQVIFDDYEKDSKPKTNKKADLMSELFGDQASKPTKSTDLDNDDIFKPPVRTTKTTATKTSGFPWDDDGKKSTTTNPPKNERASSLFGGGGSGILDDNDSSVFDSTKMLPRRGRQHQTTFQSKPAVSAIDHHDDLDIEEIIM